MQLMEVNDGSKDLAVKPKDTNPNVAEQKAKSDNGVDKPKEEEVKKPVENKVKPEGDETDIVYNYFSLILDFIFVSFFQVRLERSASFLNSNCRN